MSAAANKKVRAGGNWKKLKKTLATDEAGPSSRPKKIPRRSSSDTFESNGKMKNSLYIDAEDRDSSSPAPTSLPWFAEDLSPEDLALVHITGGRVSTSSVKLDSRQVATETTLEDDEDVSRRKKVIILGGGEDLSKEKQEPGTYIAIDCEMVGVGPEGSESVLARVSIVNWHGALLYDSFVKPREKVTDYRTWVSGVRAEDLHGAPDFIQVQAEVAKLIKGKVLVGHAIHNDLKALFLSHPRPLIRDTAQNKLCREIANTKYPSLKKLVALRLGIDIQKQGAEHSSIEDARATMALYRTLHADWQKSMSTSRAILGKGWKKPEKRSNESNNSAVHSKKTSNLDWWKEV